MIPNLEDPRVVALVQAYIVGGRELIYELQLMTVMDMGRRALILERITKILTRLREYTSSWVKREVDAFFREADTLAKSSLVHVPIANVTAWGTVNELAVQSLVNSTVGKLDKALSSVQNLATRISRATRLEDVLDAELRRQVGVSLTKAEGAEATQAKIFKVLSNRFENNLVPVIGSSGRLYHFDIGYYSGMVGHSIRRQAASLATITRAKQNDWDLVRVSPNPSTIHDYCDAYRGHVFSIGGHDSRFPPLAATPNGGPPFHPWCKHSISVFIPEFHSEEELKEWSDVDERFLMRGREDVTKLARDWYVVAGKEEHLGDLRYA